MLPVSVRVSSDFYVTSREAGPTVRARVRPAGTVMDLDFPPALLRGKGAAPRRLIPALRHPLRISRAFPRDLVPCPAC